MTVGPCSSSVASPRSTGARRAGASRRWRTSPSRSSRPSWPSWSARSAPASRPCSASSPVRSARRGAAVLVDGVEVGTLGARGLARLRRSLGVVVPGRAAPPRPDGARQPDLRPARARRGAGGGARARPRRPGRGRPRPRAERAPARARRRRAPAGAARARPGDRARGSCSPTSPRRCSTPPAAATVVGAPPEPAASRDHVPGRDPVGRARPRARRARAPARGRPAATRRAILSSYLFGATLRGCRRGGATAAAAVLLSDAGRPRERARRSAGDLALGPVRGGVARGSAAGGRAAGRGRAAGGAGRDRRARPRPAGSGGGAVRRRPPSRWPSSGGSSARAGTGWTASRRTRCRPGSRSRPAPDARVATSSRRSSRRSIGCRG